MTQPQPQKPVIVKASDAVVDYILQLLFAGTLRPGDRIDLDALAETLGLSRVPIREALAQLERDGIVTTRHHRGAFVSAFDAGTVREAIELYALLSGLTSSRVALSRDQHALAALSRLQEEIADTVDIDAFELLAREVRRVINVAAAGPHLRALMRTFRGLVPAISRLGIPKAMPKERELINDEIAAIRRGSSVVAAKAAMEHTRYVGHCGIEELIRMGVFSGEATAAPAASSAQLLRLIESVEL